MFFPKRNCLVLFKRLLVAVVLACCCYFLSNILCLYGDCFISELETKALASLSDVVLQANELPSAVDRNDQIIASTSDVVDNKVINPKKKELDVNKKMKSLHLTSLDFCPKENYYSNKTSIVGLDLLGRKTKRFLAVGIPSIRRKTRSYLKKTIKSVMNAVKGNEEGNITVVVFLADFNSDFKQKQLSDITMMFKKYITSGALQVIQAPRDYYIPLNDLHRNLGDHMDRVLWRSKQSLDYVYLMCYCSYISHYYLQLEDDVIASPRFLSKISDYVDSQKHEWISLNVAQLGYIGKLYPTREVSNLASYLRLFFNEMPVDWLEPRWKKYRGQDPGETKCRAASLFQHIGLISSFRPKESQRPNTLKEKFFDQFDQKYSGNNPPAEIFSDLIPIHGKPEDAYTKGDGYFHARFGGAGKKIYNMLLKTKRKLQRVVVETGANFAEHDAIVTGTLEISEIIAQQGKVCEDYETVGEFRFGRVDVTLNGRKVRCIRINIVYQGRWIYFREIDVWTS
ncbi:alpha-1,3-mannosyl-glycoprotein 4-beta-N-acetylglucosaminyltransferase C-like isoform X2 [Dendronephthya gigantea]|uniref:alpha-1,3-mannosyl-glycoprotein 4-beta-N-acetylglucosaminyltransferase C-like isoform X2 n=1 Tax=Dendronephthya gigantea TaxID=151771 RepID=UPI001069E6EB|nr:alpha-1,3-mannosyl-glycoprotein 4-beta-N-acetylglucosaminyltransferase C-like isoform X2 [Dendronephthya gigantea]